MLEHRIKTTFDFDVSFPGGCQQTYFRCITMQSLVNTVKGTALGVAEYLTPVLKVFLFIPSIFIPSRKIMLVCIVVRIFGGT